MRFMKTEYVIIDASTQDVLITSETEDKIRFWFDKKLRSNRELEIRRRSWYVYDERLDSDD